MQNQIPRKFAVPLPNQRVHFLEKTMFAYLRWLGFHDAIPPGIFGGMTAVKNRYRSSISPRSENARIPAAIPAFSIPSNPATGSTTPPNVPEANRKIVARFSSLDMRVAVRFMFVQSESFK